MARIKVEDIVEHLSHEFGRALEEAGQRASGGKIDFREFVKAIGRKCNTWEKVPDRFVQDDAGNDIAGLTPRELDR